MRKTWSVPYYYAYGEEGLNQSWLIPHDEYQKLDRQEAGRREAYRALFKSELDPAELKAIRESAHKGWALGSARFRSMVEDLAKRRAGPASRGRPRKSMGVENGV